MIVEVVKNNIAHETSDAITNVANSRLNHAAGIAASILKIGGNEI